MFPLHQGKELVFSSTPQKREDQQILEDLILDSHNHYLDCNHNTIPKHFDGKRQRTHHGFDDSYNGYHDRKRMHRDNERQKRHEMSTLYTSLRALLPYEVIKGKRSISDNLSEAVNYIKHLQKKITELSAKRDELKKVSNLRAEEHINCSSSSSVVIREICGGAKTEINRFVEDGLPLSRVLGVLLEQGLDVVSSVSTTVKGRLFQYIQHEAVNSTSVDPSVSEGEVIKREAPSSGNVSYTKSNCDRVKV